MVVSGLWERLSELLAEEGEAGGGDVEELGGVALEVLPQRLAAVEAEAVPPRSSRSSWNGPALTTTTYVDSDGVSGNVHTRPPSACSSTDVGAPLLVTVQLSWASTVKACGAFRSGWSKQAQARRASSASNEVQT